MIRALFAAAAIAIIIAGLIGDYADAQDRTFSVVGGAQKKLKDMGDSTFAEQIYIGGGTMTTQTAAPASIFTGQLRIASTGTAVCLPSQALVNGIVVKAMPANAAAITIGGSGVNAVVDGTGNGYVLQPGEAMSFAIPNANLACVNGAATAGVSYGGN